MKKRLIDEKGIYLISKEASPKKIVIFSHGLSDNHESALISNVSKVLCDNGLGVVVYDFSFAKSKSQPSDELVQEVDDLKFVVSLVKTTINPSEIFLIGKSLGGIVSAMYSSITTDGSIKSITIVGFPFKLGFPPNFRLLKEENPILSDYKSEYAELFKKIGIPTLIIQGDQDDLGEIGECKNFLKSYMSCSLEVVEDATHGFVSRKDKGVTYYDRCAELIINKIST